MTIKVRMEMSKSQKTKTKLAHALKILMLDMPFDKISVTKICDQAQVHRKTFYYHFKDKYDLVNWIYDSEVAQFALLDEGSEDPEAGLHYFQAICHYLYDNRTFYHKALQIEGQNSFLDHFYSLTRPLVRKRLAQLMGKSQIDDFTTDFLRMPLSPLWRIGYLANNPCPPKNSSIGYSALYIPAQKPLPL